MKVNLTMKTKKEIVDNWLVRYTGVELEKFGRYILLTNFQHYVDLFSTITGCKVWMVLIKV